MTTAISVKEIVRNYKSITTRFERTQRRCKPGLLLAHYTTAEVLEKIINNSELWMSHPFNMNDVEEMLFGVELGQKLFHDYCYSEKIDKVRSDRIFQLFQNSENLMYQNATIDNYVLCFTEHEPNDTNGSLPMWRDYGGKGHGASIVFDPAKFPKDVNHVFKLRKIRYRSSLEREDLLKGLLKEWRETTIAIDESLEYSQLYIPAMWALSIIKNFSLITKDVGFSHENEWRLIYASDFDCMNTFEKLISSNFSASGIEPKLKLNIEK